MILFQNLILFTNHYGNLQEMLKMASFLRYVDLHLTSGAGFTWDTLYFALEFLTETYRKLQFTPKQDLRFIINLLKAFPFLITVIQLLVYTETGWKI
jgi:hypothetical protein